VSDVTVEAVLQEIADRNGGKLTPDLVVQEARSPLSPIHDRFTWNQTAAAIKCRQDEARALIRSVTITVTNKVLSFEVPRYIRDVTLSPREQGYITVSSIKGDADLARETCIREFERAKQALSRAQGVAAYLGIDGDVAGVVELVEALSRRAQEDRPPGSA